MKPSQSSSREPKRRKSQDLKKRPGRRSLEVLALESRLLLTDTTATFLSASSNAVALGGSVTFTAQVKDLTNTDGTPTGSVTFIDGTTTLGSSALSSGTATYTTTSLTAGPHNITATYAGVEASFQPSQTGISGQSTSLLYAGTSGSFSDTGNGGQANVATLGTSYGIAADSNGNTYIADSDNNIVRKVTSAGVISIVAGTDGSSGYTGDGGQATAATFNDPTGLAVDASGNLYIADESNSVIRKVTTGGVISTVAGTGVLGYTGDGGQATAAKLNTPIGVAVDSSGNLYIVDVSLANVRKVTTDGVIHNFAGTGTRGFSGNGGQATAATFEYPEGVAVDASGNVYISDTQNNQVRKVTTDGVIHAFAGTGLQGFAGDSGAATAARLNSPYGLAVDSAGNVFISDESNGAIREVTLDGKINTISGLGNYEDPYTGVASGYGVFDVAALAVNSYGSLYVDDYDAAVVNVVVPGVFVNVGSPHFSVTGISSPVTAGTLETLTVTADNADGTTNTGYTGIIHLTSTDGQAVLGGDAMLTNGVGTFSVTLKTPGTQSVTATDTVTSSLTGSETAINVVPAATSQFVVTGAVSGVSGTIETINVTATDAYGNLTTGYSGTVHITSSDSAAVLPSNATLTNGVGSFKVTLKTAGIQSITATDTVTSSITGSETGISIVYPTTTTLTTSASSLTTVQSLTLTATVATITGQSTPNSGTVSFYQGSTLLGTSNVVSGTASYTINRLSAASYSFSAVYSGVAGQYLGNYAGLTGHSTINTAAGNGTQGTTGNGGQATSAELDLPSGVVFDAAGNMYIADPGAHVIRKVTPAGVISTYAGTGTAGFTGDSGQATAARLYAPYGLAIDAAGDLFIADDGSNVVRKITPSGIITTVAGTGLAGSTGNGGQATVARLDEPTGVAVDASGDLFIADSYNNEIREITTDGIIHDFAGNGTSGSTGDGGQATSAEIHNPYMVAVYGGNVYFTDFGNNKIREITTDGVIHTFAGTGTGGDTGDGGPATAAEIDGPIGLAFNAVGDLFIADYDDSTVREITTDGNIQTVAGVHDAFEYGSSKGDGGPGSAAGFYYLQGLAVDSSGNLYIADNYNASIRELGAAVKVTVTQAPATHFTVTASPANATAGTQQVITVTALDTDGNTVTNYSGTVHFTSDDSQAVLPSNATLTNGLGTFNVTLKTAGTDSITATDTVTTSITGADTGIVVTPAAASTLAVTGAIAEVAGGVETVTVTAHDAYGNVATGYGGIVHITSSDGQAVLPNNATLTNGVGTFNVTLKTAGSDSITATDLMTSSITGTQTGITVTPAAASTLAVTGAIAEVAGGVETVTVTAYDAYDNVATGYTGNVAITSSDGKAVLPANAMLTNGAGNFNVTLKTVGTQSITAKDTVTSSITGVETGIVVTPAATASLTVTGAIAEVAGGVETVTVTAYDAYGNIATGYTGNVAITSSDGKAVLPANAMLTNGAGNFNVTLETAGSDSITATDIVTPSITGVETGIVVTPAAAASLTVTGAIAEVAGGVETVTVTAYDAYDNVATGYTGNVAITSSDGKAVLPANAMLTNGAGNFNVTLKTVGTQSITAKDTVTSSITGVETGIVVTPAAAANLTVTGAIAEVAGGVETVTVTAYDAYGNIATGYTGNVAITSSDGKAVLPANAMLTNGAGNFNVTLETAGSDSITATDTVETEITGMETDIAVTPAAAANLTVTGAIAGVAGIVETVTVTAYDAYGNVATGYGGIVTISSSDGKAVLPANAMLTNGAGTFNVTLKTVGTQSITATDTVETEIKGVETDIAVTAAAAASFTVTGATAETAGGVETITVTAYDAYGNVATGYAGLVQVTSSDGKAVLPNNATLTNGVGNFNVTLKTAGLDSITATDTVDTEIKGVETGIVVTPAAASTLAVTGAIAEVAGGVETVTVTAHDAYGNIATGYDGIVHITSSDGQAVLPNNAALTNGVGNFHVTLKTAGLDSITATDTVETEIKGVETDIAVTAAAAVSFTVTGAAAETAGGVETVTVTAYDAFGNLATGYGGLVAITSSDGQAVLPANAVLTNGVGTFHVTLKTAGIDSITAKDTVTPGITGTESPLAVAPAAAASFTVIGATAETAGGIETVTVTARDAYGNVVTGYEGTVHITSSDGQAVLPDNATLTSGVGTFHVTLKTAGTQSITATDTVTPGIKGTVSPLVVTPASASMFTISSDGSTGSRVTLTVTAHDAYGNVALGYTGPVHVTSSDGKAVLPPDVTLTAGVATFVIGFSAPGTPSVTVTDTENGSLTGTQLITVTQATSQGGPVVSSAPQTYYGQDETLTASFSANGVTNLPMTGTVSFYDGTVLLGTVPLLATGQASLSTSALAVGDHVIDAVYSGDPNYTPATSQTPASVQVLHTVTSTTLAASTTAQGTVLTANVVVTSLGDPTAAGTVSFYDGTTLLGTATVSGGVATLTLGTLPAGQHQFIAVFSVGDNSPSSGSQGAFNDNPTLGGTVYLDLNANGVPDAGEPGLAGRIVFLDLNHDGTLDPGDPTATTDAAGHFTLSNTATGSVVVVEATSQDSSDRYVVDQTTTNADGSVSIGVVPISPVAPVPVVPNPFSTTPSTDPNTAYVQSLYKAVLGRTGADSEVATWLVQLSSGMTRQEVAVSFINSPEHRLDQVNTYYQEFLHRAPDPGSVLWVNELLSGVSEEKVVEGILDSPEYQTAHQDSTLFLQDLYIDILGRKGDPGGVAGWQAALASGTSREAVVADFVQCSEAIDQVVDGFYTAYLHRQPEPTTSNIWVTMLDQPDGSATDVATGILASPEFDLDAATSKS